MFREHVVAVQAAAVPADRLLTFEVRDGWEPLCAFLEVEVSAVPFPRTNFSKEFVDQEWKQEPVQPASA